MGTRIETVRAVDAPAAFALAASVGVIHAIASMYWAFGGQWQLESVGDWAVRLTAEHPVASGLLLGVIAAVKLIAAFVPWMNERCPGRFHRRIRFVGWSGGIVLTAWGGTSALAAGAVLSGLVTPSDGYNRATMIGHAFVWDPLFAIWGLALVAALWSTRTGRGTKARLDGLGTSG